MRSRCRSSLCIAAFIVLALATRAHAGSEASVTETFEYLGGANLGPEAIYGKLLLTPGAEDDALSWVLIASVQAQQLSLTGLDPRHPVRLERKKWYSTGIEMPLNAEVIAHHNLAYPALALETPYIYSVRYELRYDYDGNAKTLILGCKAILYRRGSGTPNLQVRQTYSGQFFAGPLLDQIRNRLAALKQLQKTAWL